jgi:hypothetical protein
LVPGPVIKPGLATVRRSTCGNSATGAVCCQACAAERWAMALGVGSVDMLKGCAGVAMCHFTTHLEG